MRARVAIRFATGLPLTNSLMGSDRWKLFLVTGLGSGLAPFAPGTFGTIPAAILYTVILNYLPPGPGQLLAVVGVGWPRPPLRSPWGGGRKPILAAKIPARSCSMNGPATC